MKKWNYQTKQYEPYEIPARWKTVLFTDDMDTLINCVGCGKKIKYGDCYTSKTIHTEQFGFGYAVCESCYEKEWSVERMYGK